MNAKDFLWEHHNDYLKIQRIINEINTLRELSIAIGSFDYSKDRVMTSPSPNAKYESKVDLFVERTSELHEQIRKLKADMQTAEQIIKHSGLAEDEELVMTYRFLNHRPADEIASLLDYDRSTIYRKLQSGLEKVATQCDIEL